MFKCPHFHHLEKCFCSLKVSNSFVKNYSGCCAHYKYFDEMACMLFPTSFSPQCPTQSCYSGNSEAEQQLQRHHLLGAPTQRDAERRYPGVPGKHASATSDTWAVSLCFIQRRQALYTCTNNTELPENNINTEQALYAAHMAHKDLHFHTQIIS